MSSGAADAGRLREFVAGLSVDVAIHAGSDLPLAAGAMAIDYNLDRLADWQGVKTRCCESHDLDGLYASILLEPPPFEPKAQTFYDLVEAGRRLQPGGAVHLVERHRQRASSARNLLARAFSDVKLTRLPGAAVISGREPLGADGRPETAPVTLDDARTGRRFRLETWPGLFSGDEVDPGTAVLIGVLPELAGRRVLDIGCGYGPLSVAAAARGAEVRFSDIDARALRLTHANLDAAGLIGEGALAADPRDAFAGPFDIVVTNPPTHAGSDVLQRLFASALALAPNGELLLVVRAHLHYEKWLQAKGKVQWLALADGYKVLRVAQNAFKV